MTVFLHELRMGRRALLIWFGSIECMLLICIWMFPQMQLQMDAVNAVFANMGAFTAAFGMDQLNFGTLIGFYGVECGNIMGLGGGMYAALLGIAILSKEEKERTAEFLLTHPVSRVRVLTEKLLSVFLQIILLNVLCTACTFLGVLSIGEDVPTRELLLIHLAFLLMQLEIAAVSFGISAFLRRGGIGIGLGFALLLYFLNIISNISDSAAFLHYITPYAYAEPSKIIPELALNGTLLLCGLAFTAAGILAAYLYYMKKDIAA